VGIYYLAGLTAPLPIIKPAQRQTKYKKSINTNKQTLNRQNKSSMAGRQAVDEEY
jgi:hypothetical protein